MDIKPFKEPLKYKGGGYKKKHDAFGNWSYCQGCGTHVHNNTLIKVCEKCYNKVKKVQENGTTSETY